MPGPPPTMSTDAPLPSSFDGNTDFYEESRPQKLLRRLKEEPLIPLGCLLTCWALFGATKSIRAGDHHGANRMFRRRIYAQGFTVAAMAIGGIYWQEDRAKRKEWDKLQGERKRKEKHEAWLRELEARDEEEKAWRARMERERGLRKKEAVRKEEVKKEEVKKEEVKKEEVGKEAVGKEAVGKEAAGKGASGQGVVEAVKDLVGQSKD